MQKKLTMPICESSSMIDLRYRYEILCALKNKLDRIGGRVFNIRVGGNDLCHAFGMHWIWKTPTRRRTRRSVMELRAVLQNTCRLWTIH